MYKLLLSAFVVFCIVLCGSVVQAGSGHYVSGVEGIKAASLPPPGYYWLMYNLYYNANKMKDDKGKDVGGFDVDVFANVNRFVYSSEYEIFGANYIADVVIPLVYTDISFKNIGPASFSDSEFGLGDILLEPCVLGWHGAWWDAALGVGVYLPSGYFDKKDPASPGKGFTTGMLSAGATVYFDEEKTWSASILSRYEKHAKQDQTHITYGDDFHFEWGLGKTFAATWEAGLAGYCRWQVRKDSGPQSRDQMEKAYALGPEIRKQFPEWGFGVTMRSLWEFENRTGSQGNITTLMLMKAF